METPGTLSGCCDSGSSLSLSWFAPLVDLVGLVGAKTLGRFHVCLGQREALMTSGGRSPTPCCFAGARSLPVYLSESSPAADQYVCQWEVLRRDRGGSGHLTELHSLPATCLSECWRQRLPLRVSRYTSAPTQVLLKEPRPSTPCGCFRFHRLSPGVTVHVFPPETLLSAVHLEPRRKPQPSAAVRGTLIPRPSQNSSWYTAPSFAGVGCYVFLSRCSCYSSRK
jgi:hypothetical protein